MSLAFLFIILEKFQQVDLETVDWMWFRNPQLLTADIAYRRKEHVIEEANWSRGTNLNAQVDPKVPQSTVLSIIIIIMEEVWNDWPTRATVGKSS